MAYTIDGHKTYIPPKSTVITLNENIFDSYEWDRSEMPKVDLLDELGYKQYQFSMNGKDLGRSIPIILGGLGFLILLGLIRK